MKIRKLAFLSMIILTLMITPSCWSRKELNEIAIVTAGGVDFGPTEKELSFVYQVINPSAMSAKGVSSIKTPFVTLKTSGKTLFSAGRKGTRELSRKLYFSHLQDYIISSDYAKEKGIKDLLDILYRDHELREDIYIFIAENQTAKEILSTQTILENNTGISIHKHLENTYRNDGCSRPVQLRQVINILTSKTTSLAIPTVRLSPPVQGSKLDNTQNAEQESVIKVGGFALFKKDKLIGFIGTKQARALNFIVDEIQSTIVVVPYKGGIHSIDILYSKTNIQTDIKNGKPEVLIEIRNEANVGEVNAPIDLTKLSTIKDLEKKTDLAIKNEVTNFIEEVQKKYKVDIFMFGEAFNRQHPKEWKKLEKDWIDYFTDLKVEVKVNTIIREIGMKNNPFQIEME